MIQAIFYGNPDGYPPIINGTRLLAQAGYQVDILCREYDRVWNIQYPDTTTVRRLPNKGRHTWAAYLAYVRTVWQQAHPEAAVYVGHDMHGLLPARLLAARYKRPLVYHCHDFAEKQRSLPAGSRVVRLFERLWAKTADLVIVPDAERAYVVQRELNLQTFPLVVANASLHAPAPAQHLQQSLQAMGYDWQCTVLRQGQIGAGHALETTIRSLPHWQNAKWGLAILGGGDLAFRDYLQDLAVDLDVLSQVAFLPPVAYDDVAQFTVGADLGHGLYEPVHVNNLYIATASNKLMEYMAAGIPILTSDRPGLRDLVNRYQCGVVADESDLVSIAGSVNQLLGKPEAARKMGENGRRAFLETFSYDKQFAPVLAWLQAQGIH